MDAKSLRKLAEIRKDMEKQLMRLRWRLLKIERIKSARFFGLLRGFLRNRQKTRILKEIKEIEKNISVIAFAERCIGRRD